jgi:hypothetical protein
MRFTLKHNINVAFGRHVFLISSLFEATFLQLAARLFLLLAARYPFSANNGRFVPAKPFNFFSRPDLI